MQTLDRDEVSAVVAARPEQVYALVADVTRMPEFSPEVVSCRWIGGADGPAVGARFEAVNVASAGRRWRNRPEVLVAEPGREFAFGRTERMAGTVIWRYRFEPDGEGTRVVESYEVTRPVSRMGWWAIEKVFGGGNRREVLRAGMRTTLDRIATAVETGVMSRSEER